MPPPPTKPKLKQVHTFSGITTTNTGNAGHCNDSNQSMESFKIAHSKQLQSTVSLPNEHRSFVPFKNIGGQSNFKLVNSQTIDNNIYSNCNDGKNFFLF